MASRNFTFFTGSDSDSSRFRGCREKKKSCSTDLTFVEQMNMSMTSSTRSVTDKTSSDKTTQTTRYSDNNAHKRRPSSDGDFSVLATSKVVHDLQKYDDDLAAISNRDSPITPVNRDDLRKISLLGRGQFCNVNLVSGLSLEHGKVEDDYENTVLTKNFSLRRVPYACKSIDPTKVRDPDGLIIAAIDLAHEAKILSELDHKNIIKLRGLCSETFSASFVDGALLGDTKDFTSSSIRGMSLKGLSSNPSMTPNGLDGYFLILDVLTETLSDRLARERNMAKKGTQNNSSSLDDTINQNSRHSIISLGGSSSRKKQAMYDRIQHTVLGIVKGMKYLHSREIVLRDLKPGNVGFDEEENVRLFDFGMARNVNECDPTEMCGSPRYMAPETMSGNGYTLKVDVYSFGVLLFELCTLKVPFSQTYTNPRRRQKDRKSSTPILKRIFGKKGTKKKGFENDNESALNDFYRRVVEDNLRPAYNFDSLIPCPQMRGLIKACWDANPSRRPTFDEIHQRLEDIF